MVDFIDDHEKNYGIELICRVLPIAPSTYHREKYLANSPEKRSLRSQHDDFYISEIRRIWKNSKCRYGVRKVWQQMKADGPYLARCTVEYFLIKSPSEYPPPISECAPKKPRSTRLAEYAYLLIYY
ncbi:IS3 family transposase [Psychrobacter celer]|uniref:IS3 family transposase n=1 Tax=Psychrobacter celer TaxID=306572 RepID=UPI003FD200B6